MKSLDELKVRLSRLSANGRYRVGFTSDMRAIGSIEVRAPGSGYHWDGLKRHVDPGDPLFIFQYTLDGVGYFREAGQRYTLRPGDAFAAIIPSEHNYFVGETGPSWHFFWLIIRHSYFVSRMKALRERMPGVISAAPDHPLTSAALALLNRLSVRGVIWDSISEEELIFKFMFACERFYHEQTQQAHSEQETFLNGIRAYVLRSLTRPISVEEIAALHGLSRSHFTHRFRNAAGLSPAQFIVQIRLNEAVTHLLESDDPLELIARRTGFTDANHFIKVFRKNYQTTPGQFRRQMRSRG